MKCIASAFAFHAARPWASIAFLACSALSPIVAENFVPAPAITTNITINPYGPRSSSLKSISYSTPVIVSRRGLSYYESHITVNGVGVNVSGGAFTCTPAGPTSTCTPLSGPQGRDQLIYNATGILRWPLTGTSNTLVTYVCGNTPVSSAVRDPTLYDVWDEADILVSDPAIQNNAAYFAISHHGLNDDGSFSATIVANGTTIPYTYNGQIVHGYLWETTVVRNVTQGIEQLLVKLTGNSTQLAILTGHSAGAGLAMRIIGGKSYNTFLDGGNNLVPYDYTSPTIFQGAVLMGPGSLHTPDANFTPIPMWTTFGEGEGSSSCVNSVCSVYQGDIRWAAALKSNFSQRGENIADWLSIQQIRNHAHVYVDQTFSWAPTVLPPEINGDRAGAVISAALNNILTVARARFIDRKPKQNGDMAKSHFGGVPTLDASGNITSVVYSQGAGTTNHIPLVQDSAIDSFFPYYVDPATLPPPSQTHLNDWLSVSQAIQPSSGLVLPWSANRIGSYQMDAAGVVLTPFPDLCSRFGNYGLYQQMVKTYAANLQAQGVFIPAADPYALIDPAAQPNFQAQGCGTATISNVTSSASNGSYKAGSLLPIQVTFGAPVIVTGTPRLTLNSGGIATYSSGSGTTTLVFNYAVGANENTMRLDYTATTALNVNGGSISSGPGTIGQVDLTLPSPSSPGSLGLNTRIAIDTVAPTLLSYSVLFGGVSYNMAGSTRNRLPWSIQGIRAVFSEPVIATLAGLNGVSANAVAGSGSTTVTWSFNAVNNLPATLTKIMGTTAAAVVDSAGNPLAGGVDTAFTLKCLYGDFNDDGVVNPADLLGVNTAVGKSYNVFADINGDRVVNANDVNLIRSLLGATNP